jgi:hypothetical protein
MWLFVSGTNNPATSLVIFSLNRLSVTKAENVVTIFILYHIRYYVTNKLHVFRTKSFTKRDLYFSQQYWISAALLHLSTRKYLSSQLRANQKGGTLLTYFLCRMNLTSTTHSKCTGLLLYLITLRHTTIGRTPLDEWSARRRDLWHYTTLTKNSIPFRRRDLNPQSQQARGRRPTS